MMRTIVLSFLLAASLVAADPSDGVRSAAQAWTQAVVKQDGAALDRLLADDLYFAHSNGRSVQTKAEYIASVTKGPAGYEALTLRDVTIHVYGASAVLSAYVDTKHPGAESFPVRFMQLYVQNNGQWRMTSSAATRLIVRNPQQRASNDAAAVAAVREAAIGWTTAVVKEDHATLQRLLADDLVFVHSGGTVPQNKAEYIASPENSDYDALPLRDINVRIYGNTAVLSALLDTKHKGREPSPVKTLQIYKLNSGRWQLAAFQATRISPPAENSQPAQQPK